LTKKRTILNKMTETKNYSETRQPRENNRPHYHNRPYNENRQRRNSFFRAGQIFSFLYHLTSLGLMYLLVKEGEKELAVKILMVNAGLVVFALLLAAVERKLNPKHGRPNNRGRNNNRPYNNRRPSNNRSSDRS
jgi:hypothetical protein